MAEYDEPTAKRRKLGPDVLWYQQHVPVARVSVPVLIVDSPLDFDLTEVKDVPLQVKITGCLTDYDFDFTICTPDQPKRTACRLGFDHELDQRTIQLLEDAARLGPLNSHRGLGKGPMACCLAMMESHLDSTGQQALSLRVEILLKDNFHPRDQLETTVSELLNRYLPANDNDTTAVGERWDPREFYDNVHVLPKATETNTELLIPLLQSTLFPFQRRAVRWLLQREGMCIDSTGKVTSAQISQKTPIGFSEFTDALGRSCIVNHALGLVSHDIDGALTFFQSIKGGILCEEMGLGKTVELLALICLHKQPQIENLAETSQLNLPTTGATLIITPPTILDQWKQEIREHAPGLSVYHYEGIKSPAHRTANLLNEFANSDIVLTTYNTISREVHYVAERPDRNLRSKPRYEPPKSPLTQINWWRVCLDEAQMIENGVSAAATVAKLIPRVNAWAVSGTPLKRAHKDLFGLMIFLHYQPWCKSLRLWNRLVESHLPLFRSLMSEIAIRHSKELVRDDLRLPAQTRHTITVPFTPIEEQYYSQLVHQMCEDCGFDRQGVPIDKEWNPESPAITEKMRTWLVRLRQTCLHPEVGGRNRKALGRNRGPLRSVQQVLDVMIDQNDAAVRVEQRSLLMHQIRRGQMMENAKNTIGAMEIWKQAYGESCKIVEESRAQLAAETSTNRESVTNNFPEASTNHDEHDDVDADADAILMNYRQRLRSALEVKHICIFFIGNAYFQLKSDEGSVAPESNEFNELQNNEENAYEEAKRIRTELLSEPLKKVTKLIVSIRSKADKEGFTSLPDMDLPLDYTGIESRKVFEKLDRYCEAMNGQATVFVKFRQKMVEFLRKSLVDDDEGVELQGDEYESSTTLQDEMYAYMEALRAVFADRGDALSGQENMLIRHEMKILMKEAQEGRGPAPEILIKLLGERDACRLPAALGSLRGIITEVRQLIAALQWQDSNARAQAEISIADAILRHAQQLMLAQTKSITTLEQEVNQFRDTMNNRLDYYRALQKVSDTVAPFEEEKVGQPLDIPAYDCIISDEARRDEKVAILLSKRRYLEHLKVESASSNTSRICTICQSDFEIGTLTVCGHQFCKECIQIWYNQHKTCPVCKRRLRSQDFWDITYKPAEMAVNEEETLTVSDSPSSDRSITKSIYSDISSATLNQIKDVELNGLSFGSKVDTICRHLFWLRVQDPGSKVIIFSQYREFVDVLGRAFNQYNIGFSRFDDKNGIQIFKDDPAVECFLLHAKAHATGLNLVVANHVFLCEPLINTAIELQAIARVHRIGQRRATTVWMYLVADTVEEAIYDISVTRRLSHLRSRTKQNSSRSGTTTPSVMAENALEAANSMELRTADLSKLLTTGKSGGEVVDQQDLWQCLFGKARQRNAQLGFSGGPLADEQPADSEIGRFLRAEAADERMRSTFPMR